MPLPSQCSKITTRGFRCLNDAIPGTTFCPLHSSLAAKSSSPPSRRSPRAASPSPPRPSLPRAAARDGAAAPARRSKSPPLPVAAATTSRARKIRPPLALPIIQRTFDDTPERLCVICATNPRQVVTKPCGHFSMCHSCALINSTYGKLCPICRTPIEEYENVRRGAAPIDTAGHPLRPHSIRHPRMVRGSSSPRRSPRALPEPIRQYSTFAIGNNRSLFVAPDGRVLVLGVGSGLGIGDGIFNASVPTFVPNVHDAVEVAAGDNHSLILLNNGDVLACGVGSATGLLPPSRAAEGASSHNFFTPQKIPSIANCVSIACGATSSMVLLQDGTVWVFGVEGDRHHQVTPVPVPRILDAVAISASEEHFLILLRTGAVLIFGRKEYMFENEDIVFSASFDRPVTIPEIQGAVAVSAGVDCCLVLLRSGVVLEFGRNNRDFLTPTPIPGVASAVRISAGYDIALILLTNGTLLRYDLLGGGGPPEVIPNDGGPVENMCAGTTYRKYTISYRSGAIRLYSGNPQKPVDFVLRVYPPSQ